tara:strand:+ start:276 stop:434 length:159 start_codon:yes stop_codon:yes gene_type:complete
MIGLFSRNIPVPSGDSHFLIEKNVNSPSNRLLFVRLYIKGLQNEGFVISLFA